MKKYLLLILSFAYQLIHSQTIGLLHNSDSAFNGYTLFAPNGSDTTYLIDNCGRRVHEWASAYFPGNSVALLNDGTLFHTARLTTLNPAFSGGGAAGRVEKIDWDGNLTWAYDYSSSTFMQHHDAKVLPNGNVLLLAWERFDSSTAVAYGRNPAKIFNGFVWCEFIVEVAPTGNNSGNIVWEWHLWDHVVQEFDVLKPNYDTVTLHPELLDLNYTQGSANSDWIHANSIDYNPFLDEIMLGSRTMSEIYIIDHSTTTAEAATHSGGSHNKGGDFLFRWGNQQVYGHGTNADKKLYGQHSALWIEPHLPDSGKIIVFNNGIGRPGGNYSSVEIISPVKDSTGNYTTDISGAFLPDTFSWHYQAPLPASFYSSNISGAEQQPNGNVLICEGDNGIFFEVDSMGNKVWQYVNPVSSTGILAQGAAPYGNSVFRIQRYSKSDPRFSGKDLTPSSPIEINPLPVICDVPTEIERTVSERFRIFPVPASDEFFISVSENFIGHEMELIDLTGRVLKIFKINSTPFLVSDFSIANGVYFLRLRNFADTGATKFLIQR